MATTSPTGKLGHEIRDKLLTELALRERKVTPELVQKGRSVLEEMGKFGISRLLISVLADRNLIERRAEKEVQREFAKIAVNCIRCRQPVSLEELSSDATLRCRQCQSVLEVELIAAEPAGGRKSRIEDRIKVTLVSSGDLGGVEVGLRKTAQPGKASAPESRATSTPAPSRGGEAPPRAGLTPSRGGAAASRGGESPSRGSPTPSRAGAPPSASRGPGRETTPPPEGTKRGEKAEALAPAFNVHTGITRYKVESPLSSGPNGRLYRASSGKPGGGKPHPLVLKLFDSGRIPDASLAAALRAEFEGWNRLEPRECHPPQILEEEESHHYLVRPYLGEPYVPLSETHFTDPRARQETLRRIVLGLMLVHSQKRVHGNLKPSNIFIRPDDERVILVDSGLHVLHTKSDNLTRWKHLSEDPRYRSPEEIDGQEPSTASDVYALGWIFHAVLSGTPPFVGVPAPEILRRHKEGPCPELPEEMGGWKSLVAGMTAFKPEERLRDAASVLQGVNALIAGKKLGLLPVTARPTASVLESRAPPRKAKRRQWSYALAPTLFLAVLAGTGWQYTTWSQARAAFSEENRDAVLYQGLTQRAFQEAHAAAKADPERGREVWESYLTAYPGSPFSGAARAELANFPAPPKPRN